MLERLLILCALLLAAQSAGAVTIYRFTDANGVVSFTDRPTPGASVMVFKDRMVERIDRQVHLSTRRDKGVDSLYVRNVDRMVERIDRQVHLSTRRDKGVDSLYVRNDLYAPVEIELKISGVKNVLGVADQTIRRTIAARSNERVTVLSPKIVGKAMSYKTNLRSIVGDPQRSSLAYRYPLPWIGGPFRLSQGPNGRYSHFGAKGRYAMDIAMPEGTPIIAARGGVVVKVENEQTGKGSNPSGNFVRILHDDGTMGVYLHLMRGSVSVKEGQHVVVGTALARSGNTGNSTGPHLHFAIQRNVGLALESIPYEFAQPVQSLPNFAVGGN